MAKKITKELSNAISGKTSEISRPYKELSKIDVIKFLNWYSGFGDINDIKGYAVDYVNQKYGKDYLVVYFQNILNISYINLYNFFNFNFTFYYNF